MPRTAMEVIGRPEKVGRTGEAAGPPPVVSPPPAGVEKSAGGGAAAQAEEVGGTVEEVWEDGKVRE